MIDEHEISQLEKHIRTGWIAGIISAIMTLLLAFLGMLFEEIRLKYGADAWALFDVAILLGLTFGLYKKNRWAALSLVIYFVIGKILMTISSGQFTGGALSLIFVFFYLRAAIASFKIHNHLISTGEKEKKFKKRGFVFYLGASIGTLLLLVLALIIVVAIFSPDTTVVPGEQLNKKYSELIYEEELIDDSEEIQYWYSDALFDFKEGFYFLTNKQVVLYSKYWEEPSWNIYFEEIDSIEFFPDPSFLYDSYIVMYLRDSTVAEFPVSSDYKGDEKFYNRLIELSDLEEY